MTDETVYDESEDEEFDGYISDSEIIRIIGLDTEMGECSKENESETENSKVCEGGNVTEINDGEINMMDIDGGRCNGRYYFRHCLICWSA